MFALRKLTQTLKYEIKQSLMKDIEYNYGTIANNAYNLAHVPKLFFSDQKFLVLFFSWKLFDKFNFQKIYMF